MDEPHVLVVNEKVDSLLFEFDLMGNLVRRYSSIDNVNHPMLSKEMINNELDDTMKMNLTLDVEPTSPGDDVQDDAPISDERNVEPDATGNLLKNKSILIEQPNGPLILGKKIDDQLDDTLKLDLTPDEPENAGNNDEHENETGEEYVEFDPMDYLCIKSIPTEKSNDIRILEEKNDKFYEAMDVDLPPVECRTEDQVIQNESETAKQDIVFSPVNEFPIDFVSSSNLDDPLENEINEETDQEMRQNLSLDEPEAAEDSVPSNDFANKTCKNDEPIVELMTTPENIAFEPAKKLSDDSAASNNLDHLILEKENDKIDQAMKVNISLDEPEVIKDYEQNNDFESKLCKNFNPTVKPMKTPKEQNVSMPPTIPELTEDIENALQEDSNINKLADAVNVSSVDDGTSDKDKAIKNEPKRIKKKLQVISIKGKVYNTRKTNTKKIAFYPDLGSDVSSTSSSSSDEESSSWSESTTVDSNDESSEPNNSDSVFEEPLRSICSRYNLRNR